jgi:hypothetical protein
MPRALPVFLAIAAAGVLSRLSLLWIREGSDGSMLTRLRNWVQASRERKRERVAADYGSLSKQEQEEVNRLRGEHSGAGTISPDRDFGSRPGT